MKLKMTQVFAISEIRDLNVRVFKLNDKIAKKSAELLEKEGIEVENIEQEAREERAALKRENDALKSQMETMRYDLVQAQRDRDYWNATNREHAAKLKTAEESLKALKAAGHLCEHDSAPSVCPSCKYIKEPQFTPGEVELIKAGKPIEATKAVRTRTNIGLKEAKAVVDAWAGRL